METNINNYSIWIDLDGTLIKHQGTLQEMFTEDAEVLPGVREKLQEWCGNSYDINITTARPNSLRKRTEEQLLKAGIYYDQLIMGGNCGKRWIINDRKKNNTLDSCAAINVDRNVGLVGVELK